MSENFKLKLVSSAKRDSRNPYVDLFCKALEEHGIQFDDTSFDSILRNPSNSKFDGIHIHWPERMWRAKLEGLLNWMPYLSKWSSLVHALRRIGDYPRLALFKRTLSRMKAHNKKVIWTVHNLEPHEGSRYSDWLGTRYLARAADLIICHSENAAVECKKRWRPTGKIIVMPHGNYDGCIPEPDQDREKLFRHFDLDPKLPTVCLVGGLRRYKGLDVACELFESKKGCLQGIIAGPPHVDYPDPILHSRLSELENVHYRCEEISSEELSNIFSASDLAIFPYHKATTSGALMMALTCGKAIVASDLPAFRDVIAGAPDAGRLVNGSDFVSLAKGIEAMLEVPIAKRRNAVKDVCSRYNWSSVIIPVAKSLLESENSNQ